MLPWKQLLLFTYYHATYPWRLWNNRRAAIERRLPIAVLFFHRIADDRANAWTISHDMFLRQINWLECRFDLISLQEAQQRIRDGVNQRPSACITFDDGYADNCQRAIPLLIDKGIPCTYFVTLHNVLSGEPFSHDLIRGKPLKPNTLAQLRDMAKVGIDIGAHCYSHADLGAITDRRLLYYEVIAAGEELQRRLDRKIRYFAFPFGQRSNLNREVFEMAREFGYEGVCSAYGGLNCPGGDPFHIQRVGVDADMIGLKHRTTADPCRLRRAKYDYKPFIAGEKDEVVSDQWSVASR
jgi:peptidoglycan/xylan/chitin deacetylase (PgdA/CDA1 family)